MVNEPLRKKISRDGSYTSAVHAFRTYARLGLDSDDLPPYVKYTRIKGIARNEREAASLLAVCDTLRILRLSGKRSALSAVRQIWMTRCFYPIGKREISMRVRKASFLLFCDDRTVYRYLRTAADIYGEIMKESGYTADEPSEIHK